MNDEVRKAPLGCDLLAERAFEVERQLTPTMVIYYTSSLTMHKLERAFPAAKFHFLGDGVQMEQTTILGGKYPIWVRIHHGIKDFFFKRSKDNTAHLNIFYSQIGKPVVDIIKAELEKRVEGQIVMSPLVLANKSLGFPEAMTFVGDLSLLEVDLDQFLVMRCRNQLPSSLFHSTITMREVIDFLKTEFKVNHGELCHFTPE